MVLDHLCLVSSTVGYRDSRYKFYFTLDLGLVCRVAYTAVNEAAFRCLAVQVPLQTKGVKGVLKVTRTIPRIERFLPV